jgi:putative ABC transport system permease protein
MYTPMGRFPLGNVTLAVRSSGADPATLIDSIKAEIRATSPNVPISNVATLESLLARHIAPRRFNVSLLAFFAGVALLLAVIGIYGVMSYAVTQRTRELGIRIALGARKGDVFRLMLGASARLVASGLCLGLIASMALTRWLKSLLFGVSATDPSTLVAISLLLVLSALLASWIPARRAAKVDPMVALRYE